MVARFIYREAEKKKGKELTEDEKDIAREEWIASSNKHSPLGHIQTPEEIGKVAVFLASSEACSITGDAITVAGGMGI